MFYTTHAQVSKYNIKFHNILCIPGGGGGGAIQKVRDIYGGGWVIFGVKSKKYLCTF